MSNILVMVLGLVMGYWDIGMVEMYVSRWLGVVYSLDVGLL